MAIKWQINGIDLEQFGVQRGTVFRSPTTARESKLEIPGRHGSVPTGRPPVFNEPQVSFRFFIKGSEVDTKAARIQAILAAQKLTLTRNINGAITTATAKLATFTPGDYLPGRYATFDALLTIPGVFFRGSITSGEAIAFNATRILSLPHLAGATGPITDAVFRIAGPLTSIYLTDPQSGQGLIWAGSGVTAGQYLYLDAGNLRAWRSGSNNLWTPGGVDVTAQLDYPAAGILQLWPTIDGAVEVKVEGAGFGGTTSLMVRAQPSYL